METEKKKTRERKIGRCNDIHLDYLQDTLSSSKILRRDKEIFPTRTLETSLRKRDEKKKRKRERERRADSVIGEEESGYRVQDVLFSSRIRESGILIEGGGGR